jgi:AcrR family transcriptional regulator
MLLDAALRAMTTRGLDGTAVADVLREAGLSTRSFYRHFESKDAVVAAVVRREAELVEQWLRQGIAAAPDPVAALGIWLDRALDLFFHPARASRTALFATPEVVRSARIPEDLNELRRLVFGPLVEVLEAGNADGSLLSPTPDLDAITIFEMVSSSARAPGTKRRSRRLVRAHVVRFAWPALGLTPDD